MKTIIAKTITVTIMVPLIPVVLIGYILYALFRGVASESVFDAYFDILERFVDFLLYPYYKYLERKNYIKKLKQKVDYYREENIRLNNELEKNEKEKEL